MPSVYPVMTSIGYQAGDEYTALLRRYADGSYRRWMNGTFDWAMRTLQHKDIKQANRDLIRAFFKARWSSSNDFEFYLYDPEEVSAIDLTGVITTGRHTAIFIEPKLEFTRSGKCRWSCEVPIALLN